jgi:hypothetical protein
VGEGFKATRQGRTEDSMTSAYDDGFDLANLALEAGEVIKLTTLPSKKEERRRQRFVKLPWSWIEAIARDKSRGRAVWVVACHIQHRTWQKRKGPDKSVKLPNGMLRLDNVSRFAKLDALKTLERLGLILVDWRLRKSPVVTILVDPP